MITARSKIFCIFLICSILSSYAQRVKYKDLFLLLNAKKYEDAEPFLRAFLNNDKNDDHANAHFQMAMLLEYKAEQYNMVTETSRYNEKIDSALLFYKKAMELIDEKEVRKNDEYYEEYLRRDLRTGKLDIKLSDVQLDIEQRIQDLSTRGQRINRMKSSYTKAEEYYNRCSKIYEDLQDQYNEYFDLVLQAEPEVVSRLDTLALTYDSAVVRQKDYFQMMETLVDLFKTPIVEEMSIDDFQKDGGGSLDLQADLQRLWDYREWALDTKHLITEEIIPMYEDLISYDAELEAKYNDVINDGVIVQEEKELGRPELVNDLLRFDEDPLPLNIFNLRTKNIMYHSYLNEVKQKGLMDTLNIDYKVRIVNNVQDQLQPLKFTHRILQNLNINIESKIYGRFITARYEDASGLINFITDTGGKIKEQEEKWNTRLQELEERKQWIINENDSIPLVKNATVPDNLEVHQYLPFTVVDSIPDKILSGGVVRRSENEVQGYYVTCNSMRTTDHVNYFDLGPDLIRDITSLNTDIKYDPGSSNAMILFYNSSPQENSYKSFLAKVNDDNSVVWTRELDLEYPPYKVEYNDQSSVYVIHYDLSGIGESGVGSSKSAIYIDKDGNLQEEGN